MQDVQLMHIFEFGKHENGLLNIGSNYLFHPKLFIKSYVMKHVTTRNERYPS